MPPVPTLALVTGASRGLGAALAAGLAADGWEVVVDARDPAALRSAVASMPRPHAVHAVPGDITDPEHRLQLVRQVEERGPLGLVVNNASDLGPTPLPSLAQAPLDGLRQVLETNVIAPLALLQALLPWLSETGGTVVNVSSDAAVEPYAGWGVYGASKAALDHVSAVLGVEHAGARVYAFDPGDMRTAMHQAAFPGEDISDRADPDEIVPLLLALLHQRPPSGRYRATDLTAAAGIVA